MINNCEMEEVVCGVRLSIKYNNLCRDRLQKDTSLYSLWFKVFIVEHLD